MNKFVKKTTDSRGNVELELNYPRIIATGAIVLVLLLVLFNSFSCVSATNRGVRKTFGEASHDILQPGLHVKAPFIQSISMYSVVPNKISLDVDIAKSGAISRDNQIIGGRLVMYWSYDETRIYEAATEWSTAQLENVLNSQANESFKAAIGQYTIFDLAANQETIKQKIATSFESQVKGYPVKITQVNISNFDWSKEFDDQIQATMNAAQQVKQAEQKANIAEQENRRLSIEAEAKAKAQIAEAEGRKRTAELDAEAAILRANGEKEAEIARATGVAEANRLIRQELGVMQATWAHEEKMAYYDAWNGVDTTTYIPLTAAGAVVTMPSK
jgi:regulator of protease activity HflC (stomatin/prohibitin superfamily)